VKIKLLLLACLSFFMAEVVLADDSQVGRLYQERCMTCHGVYGDGQGVLAEHLNPKPRDFTDYNKMRHLSGDTHAIVHTILHGVPGTAMPAFGSPKLDGEPLTHEQAISLTKYVQSFLAEEQYLLQLCVGAVFVFETMLDGQYSIESHSKDLFIMEQGPLLSISTNDYRGLMKRMLKERKRAIRTHFKVLQDKKIPLLVTVRFNSPCPDYLKKTEGYKMTRVF
jgi:hypothetical protein